ncbi:MAG: SusC/RagA family TonB-linked outer membrane protein [Alistipes sp.]|nr:SusC/RagA family TonB-linked outer membrane protein [Alistipes sp.]
MKNLFSKMLFISAFLLVLGGGSLTDARAQNTTVTVTGKVLDSGNQPLAGAVVLVKGTTRGATTTADGSFTIRAKQSDALVFSMLGYAEQEIVIGQRTSLTVNLQDEASAIDEVVIEVGYGTQAKKDITGTVSMVKIEDALKAPVVNFEESLAGRVAGVQISSADGQPGQEMDIVIRGANSLTQSNSPLYVVDGFPMEDFSASAINSNDIESFTILKDASATAIYGARGANGVIIIETKKGQEGKATITYNGNYGFQQVANTMDMMNAAQFVEYQIERSSANADKYLNIPGRTMEDYKAMGEGINWQDKLFRNAPIQMHNVSLTGGTKQTKYAASISVADQEGVILNSGYQKYQGRV